MAENSDYTQSRDEYNSKWFCEQPGMLLRGYSSAPFRVRNLKSVAFRNMGEVFGIRRLERRRFTHNRTE